MSTVGGITTRKRHRDGGNGVESDGPSSPPEIPPQDQPQQESAASAVANGGKARNCQLSQNEAPGRGDENSGDEGPEIEGQEKKLRFVWTAQLHQRFEAAVLKLGVSHAKPQAIRQLMSCEGEESAPTRQNIKSHLQKYRLLVQKQAAAAAVAAQQPPPSTSVLDAGANVCAFQGVDGGSMQHVTKLGPLLQRQQVCLLAQLELHAKLHAQLLTQRRTQTAIGHGINLSSHSRMLRHSQLQRLAQHVLMQRQMLQHLYSLLHACSVDMCGSNLAASIANPELQRLQQPPMLSHEEASFVGTPQLAQYLNHDTVDEVDPMHIEVQQAPLQASVMGSSHTGGERLGFPICHSRQHQEQQGFGQPPHQQMQHGYQQRQEHHALNEQHQLCAEQQRQHHHRQQQQQEQQMQLQEHIHHHQMQQMHQQQQQQQRDEQHDRQHGQQHPDGQLHPDGQQHPDGQLHPDGQQHHRQHEGQQQHGYLQQGQLQQFKEEQQQGQQQRQEQDTLAGLISHLAARASNGNI